MKHKNKEYKTAVKSEGRKRSHNNTYPTGVLNTLPDLVHQTPYRDPHPPYKAPSRGEERGGEAVKPKEKDGRGQDRTENREPRTENGQNNRLFYCFFLLNRLNLFSLSFSLSFSRFPGLDSVVMVTEAGRV